MSLLVLDRDIKSGIYLDLSRAIGNKSLSLSFTSSIRTKVVCTCLLQLYSQTIEVILDMVLRS